MTTNFEFALRYKSDYLEFSHEISKLRNDGDKVPQSLLLKAITAGCLADVPEDQLQTVEGFAICQACLSSDAELAVHLARARHQKRLQRLKEELDH